MLVLSEVHCVCGVFKKLLSICACYIAVVCVADDKIKSEIVVLSIAANIVSKHTSMVGVDLKNKDKVAGDSVQRQVPLMMSAQSAYVSIFIQMEEYALQL